MGSRLGKEAAEQEQMQQQQLKDRPPVLRNFGLTPRAWFRYYEVLPVLVVGSIWASFTVFFINKALHKQDIHIDRRNPEPPYATMDIDNPRLDRVLIIELPYTGLPELACVKEEMSLALQENPELKDAPYEFVREPPDVACWKLPQPKIDPCPDFDNILIKLLSGELPGKAEETPPNGNGEPPPANGEPPPSPENGEPPPSPENGEPPPSPENGEPPPSPASGEMSPANGEPSPANGEIANINSAEPIPNGPEAANDNGPIQGNGPQPANNNNSNNNANNKIPNNNSVTHNLFAINSNNHPQNDININANSSNNKANNKKNGKSSKANADASYQRLVMKLPQLDIKVKPEELPTDRGQPLNVCADRCQSEVEKKNLAVIEHKMRHCSEQAYIGKTPAEIPSPSEEQKNKSEDQTAPKSLTARLESAKEILLDTESQKEAVIAFKKSVTDTFVPSEESLMNKSSQDENAGADPSSKTYYTKL